MFVGWQKLSQRVGFVSPLHRRMPLSRGLHKGVLLTSVSLPSGGGRPGQILPSGTRVHVRANRPADLIHREWFLVDLANNKENTGLVVASVPAAFVWLDSPETSPERVLSNSDDGGIKRCQSVSSIPEISNNFERVER